MSARLVGYSGTQLAKKLGIGASSCVWAIDAPANYRKLLAPLPVGATFVTKLSPGVDVVHLFVDNAAALAKRLASLRKRMRPDASLWVSWPKKAAKIPTDVTEDTIRSIALPIGLVDVKVCAVSEVWSGLKLVIRKELR